MPTYEYACKSCGTHSEVVQSFTDDALTTCESCGGQLRKVFGAVGISFKGSGFYKTDSRPASPASSSTSKPAETSKESKESSTSSSSDPKTSSGDKSTAAKSSDSSGSAKAS